MAKKGMDIKQLAMNQGEKIGLGVGAALMLLLVFWGVTSGTSSPTSKDEIAANATTASNAIASRQVDEPKLKPPDTPSSDELNRRKVAFNQPIPDDAFPLPYPFYRRMPLDDVYKTNPDVFAPIEMVAKPGHSAIRIRQIVDGQVTVLDPDKTINIKAVQNKVKKDDNRNAVNRFRQGFADAGGGMAGMDGMAGGMMGMMGRGMRGMGGMGIAGMGKPFGKPLKPEDKKEEVQPEGQLEIASHAIVKKIADVKPDDVIAETLAPVRYVLVVGTFPHKKQMQEIARAMKWEEDSVPLLYRGPEVQRREIVPKNTLLPNGERAKEDLVIVGPNRFEPVDAEKGWVTLDFKKGPIQKLFSLVVEFEKEQEPLLKALEIGRLVMALPKPQRGTYPALARDLKSVKEAMDQLEKEAAANAPPPREHPGLPKDFDPFNPEAGTRGGDETAKPGAKPGGLAPMKAGSGGGKAGTDDLVPAGEPGRAIGGTPTNSLIRFLDIDPQMRPGRTYEYRVRVVLQNPNYKNFAQVAEQSFALMEELKGAWSSVIRVTLPEETGIYADAREIKGIDRETRKAAIQLHKWLPGVRTSADFHPVGDWWVEKVMVGRGEYIGRVNETKYVVWVSTAIDPATNKIGVDVFKNVKNDAENLSTGALLVDFETYERAGQTVPGGGNVQQRYGNRVWIEETPTEVLFVDEQGRLMAHHQHRDKENQERAERHTRWENWLVHVRETLKGIKKEGTGGNVPQFDK